MRIINQSQDKTSKPLINLTHFIKCAINAMLLISMFNTLSHRLIDEDELDLYDHDTYNHQTLRFSFYCLLNFIWLGLEFHGWKRQVESIDVNIKTTAEELLNSHLKIEACKEDRIFSFKPLPQVIGRAIPDHSYLLMVTPKDPTLNASFIWEMGQESLYKQIKALRVIFNDIELAVKNENLKFKLPTYPFKSHNFLWPYRTHCLDFPSKTRYLNMTTWPAYLFTKMLISNNFIEDASFLQSYLTVSFLLIGTTLVESYLLNKNRLRLNLEGFTHFYQACFSTMPTCIGQQLNESLILYPRNRHLKAAFQYLNQSYEVLVKVQSNKKLNLPQQTKKQINEFINLVKTSEVTGLKLFSIFELNNKAKFEDHKHKLSIV